MVWLAIIGSASIQIRADDKYFEPDVQRAVKRIKNVAIQLKADVDITKASKKIRDLRYRITSKDAVLKVDANVAKAEEKLARLLAKFINKDLNFNAVAHTQGANTALTELRDRFVSTRVPFTATANTAAARAGLAAAARNRVSVIRAILDPASIGALKASLNILSGTLPFAKIQQALLGVVTGFESLSLMSGVVVTAIGAISAAILTTGGNLLAITRDIGQATGAIALLPAGLFGLVTILKANKMAWLDFGTAAADNSKKANEALAKLPPEAQKAAVALRGVREQIQKPVQKAFWEAAGTSLQDMVEAQLPTVIRGMTGIGAAMGGFTREVFDTVKGLSGLGDMFSNVENSIRNMTGGVKPAIQALSTFTSIGATYLPQFGTWLTELGNKFGAFTEKAAASGQIVSWINVGIQRLQEIGSVASSTIGIFSGLANAAELSGASGLTELAAGMDNVANIVNSEPFQSQLISILEGARSGTEKMGEGFRTLTKLIGQSADGIGIFLDKAGEVAGLTFESITALFDGTGLGSGLMDMLDGLSEALVILAPGFGDLGATIGDLGGIAGELFVNTASGLNLLFDTINKVVAALKDGVIGAMPVLNSFVQALMSAVSGPLIALAEIVGNALEVFADMPQVVQYAIAAIGLFLLLGPKIEAMWGRARIAAATAFTGMATDVDSQGERIRSSFGRNADAIRDAWRNVGTELNNGAALSGAVSGMDRLAAATDATRRAIGTTVGQGLRMAGNGLMSALGGPWGAAIAGATVLVGLYANAQAEARAKVDELKGSLDQVTGAFTGDSRRIIASDIIDFESGKDAWSEMWRFGRKTAVEQMDAIGLSVDDVSKKLTDPNTGQEYGDAWQKIGKVATSSIGGTLEITDELAAAVGMTTEELEAMGAQDLATLAHGIGQAAKSAETARREIQELAERTGTNTIAAAQLAKNYDILSKATSSANEKFSAMKQNIDLLSGGQRTAHGVAREYAQSLEDQKKSMSELIEKHGGVVDSTGRMNDAFRGTLLNADNSFSTATQGARDFSVQMDVAADSILKQGTAELDKLLKSGAKMPEAMAGAMNVMQPAVDTLRGTLATLGFDAGQVDAIIKQLGLDPEKLRAAMSVDTSKAEIDVARLKLAASTFADGNYEAVLAALPQGAKDAISQAMGLGEEFAKGDYKAILATLDKTAGGKEAALASLLTYEGTDWFSFLKAHNLIPEEVARANAAADKLLPEKTTTLRADDLATMTVESANAYVLGDKRNKLVSDDLVTNVLNTINNSPLGDKQNTLTTTDLVTQMVNDVNSKQLNNKLSSLETRDLVTSVVDTVNRMTLNGKSNTLTAHDLATAVVNAVNATVLRDKSFSITTRYLTSGNPVAGAGQVYVNPMENANGNILNSNGTVRRFADGGILSKLRTPAIKAFAGGGIENHTAQIARGAWPVRVWAEPETGGEAYIPLSKNKRKRSLEILRQVMNEFGLAHLAQFADGGIMKTMKSSPVRGTTFKGYQSNTGAVVSATARAAAAPTIITNVYPSQGLNEKQVAGSVSENIYWKLSTQI